MTESSQIIKICLKQRGRNYHRNLKSDVDLDKLVEKVELGYELIGKMKDRLSETKDKIEELHKKYEDLEKNKIRGLDN